MLSACLLSTFLAQRRVSLLTSHAGHFPARRVFHSLLSCRAKPSQRSIRAAIWHGTRIFCIERDACAPRDENISRLQLRLMVLINRNFDFNVFSVFNKLKTNALRNGTTLRFNLILKNWLEVTFKNFENYTSLFLLI